MNENTKLQHYLKSHDGKQAANVHDYKAVGSAASTLSNEVMSDNLSDAGVVVVLVHL